MVIWRTALDALDEMVLDVWMDFVIAFVTLSQTLLTAFVIACVMLEAVMHFCCARLVCP